MKSLTKIAVAAAMTVGLVAAGGTAANAATSTGTCTGSVQYAHPSSGAGGAVSKIDISCTGFNTKVTHVGVQVKGLMTFAAASSPSVTKNVVFSTRAGLNQTQQVPVNGGKVTYYLPQLGSNGGHGTGFWRTTYTWQVVSGAVGVSVGSKTDTNWRTI